MTIPETGTVGIAPTGAQVVGPVLKREHPFRRLLRDPVAVICLVVLAVLILASIFAPLLTGTVPGVTSLKQVLAAPSPGYPLGGDGSGGNIWTQLLYGGRTAFLGSFLTVVVAFLIGIPAGIIAGYYRGWFDAAASWLANLAMAVPVIIVLILVSVTISNSIYVGMIVLGLLISAGVYRLIRASVTSVREELYVDAARVSGLSDARIMRRHILPVVQAPSIIQASQLAGLGVVISVGLQFLGLGGTEPSWGAMLNDAFGNIYTKPSLLIWPSAAIILTVTAFALLGNSLRDSLVGGSAPSRRRKRPQVSTAKPASHKRTTTPATSNGKAPDTGALLSIASLRVAYPTKDGESVVVDGVSLSVRRGEVLGLVGESGSGKSQTAFSVLGLLPPNAEVNADHLRFGDDELLGLGRAAMNKYRGRRIGYIPQEPLSNLDPSFKIGTQLIQPIRQHLKISRAEATKRALALLDRVGIPDPKRVFNSYPHQISGGMAQRILIAGAVSCDPDLLIADEPTTALDVTVQAEVLDLIRSLQQERNMGVILVTHDFGVVADVCDQVAVMKQGKIVEVATAEQLFAHPEHEYTQMLLASTLENTDARKKLV